MSQPRPPWQQSICRDEYHLGLYMVISVNGNDLAHGVSDLAILEDCIEQFNRAVISLRQEHLLRVEELLSARRPR